MDKSNIIISIIIVICIAAGVAAYGITNSENPIFSNLNSLDSGSGDSGNQHYLQTELFGMFLFMTKVVTL